MPVVRRFGPYVFRIHSDENDPAHEPPHIHVESAGRSAVFWLAPVCLRDAWGYTPERSSGSVGSWSPIEASL